MFTRVLHRRRARLTLVPGPARRRDHPHDGKEKATAACQGINEYGPVEVAETGSRTALATGSSG